MRHRLRAGFVGRIRWAIAVKDFYRKGKEIRLRQGFGGQAKGYAKNQELFGQLGNA